MTSLQERQYREDNNYANRRVVGEGIVKSVLYIEGYYDDDSGKSSDYILVTVQMLPPYNNSTIDLEFSHNLREQLLALGHGQHIRFSGKFPYGIVEEFKHRLDGCSLMSLKNKSV